MAPARRTEPVVTTTMFTPAEQAAWEVAKARCLSIDAADLRALLSAGAHPGLTPEQRLAARDLFDAGVCPDCGGIHQRACPRVQSYVIRYKPETNQIIERSVTFFPPGTWEENVLFRDDVYEEDDQ